MRKRHWTQKWLGMLAAVAMGLGPISSAWADATLSGPSWVDTLKFGGDLRLRHDSMLNSGGRTDRSRERYRMRFGVEATIQDVQAVVRLASGTGSQVSENQTETGAFGQNALWIDLAYLQYKPFEQIKLVGGKMPNPFWQLYASDSMWDPDLFPTGYAEKAEFPGGERLKLFANAAQLPINEISGSEHDQWVLGEQIGAKITLFEETKVTMALADYSFTNPKVAAFGGTIVAGSGSFGAVQGVYGNSMSAAGVLRSNFNVLQFTNELAFHAGSVPLSLQGDFVTNTQEQTGNGRNGYQTGVIAGKASAAHTWEGAYFYKYLQADATVSNFSDDDFGNGGTNRAGHIFWIAYAPRDYVQFKLKYYVTRVLNRSLSSVAWNPNYNATFDQNLNRLFLDIMVKF